MQLSIFLLSACLYSVATALFAPVFQHAALKYIWPEGEVNNIGEKIKNQITDYNKRETLTTSFLFPEDYSSTIYKDREEKTTLVNVFPRHTIGHQTVKYQSFSTLTPSTSTTTVNVNVSSSIEYFATPVLNYSDPQSHQLYQTWDYVSPEFQHETLVYSTSIPIIEYTSTRIANFTALLEQQNEIPFV